MGWSNQKSEVDQWNALPDADKTTANAPSGLKRYAKNHHDVPDEASIDPAAHIQERADDIAVNAAFFSPFEQGTIGVKKRLKKKLKLINTSDASKTAQQLRAEVAAVDTNEILAHGIEIFTEFGLI